MTSLTPWRRGASERRGDQDVAPLAQMRSDWDRMFDRLLGDVWSPSVGNAHGMLLDCSENDEEIRIRAEVPGMDPENLDISLAGDVLTLSGEKVDQDETREGSHYYSERHFGSYQRSVKLPCPVDPEQVQAEHKNGVVTIRLRKAEAVRPKRIQIKPA